MLHNITGWHGLIVLAVIILLFGAGKLPQLARGLGQSIRIFRTETRDLRDPEPDEPAPAGTDGAATAPHGEQTAATRVDAH
ncbi:twin-arginine translocase TatA/TatE family subunit [Rathayibacter sp. VKM Ac-2759]|uniref:twin-arginine translocase TatA/TatE family subunit n=1 Tax=Rathayibacter sp. VKM Ac-2759 TaxID=2609252 RepID=UPI001316A97B|nr:twin-arginine translocase TatA/TatE family subunit [Rathayibacter sp. VKM Ac-2759]QHC65491.1 twin-arginine translocase TatA/TatE family subunit [Rathayibacter sp. VKM Ac-2759]